MILVRTLHFFIHTVKDSLEGPLLGGNLSCVLVRGAIYRLRSARRSYLARIAARTSRGTRAPGHFQIKGQQSAV